MAVTTGKRRAEVAEIGFEWSALPGGLLRQLKDELGIEDSDVARVLAARYGPAPTEVFVKEAWKALRDGWIAKDPVLRRTVVSSLRARGLGAAAPGGSSARAEVAYLRSCRNAHSLRAVVLAHLVALGRPASAVDANPGGTAATRPETRLEPRPETRPEPRPETRPEPPSGAALGPDELRARVKEVVRSVVGVDDVLVDKDGDIPIRSQASVTYVRVFRDAPVVRVFSPVLWDLGNPSGIEEAVNEINRTTNWVKAVWDNGTVVLFSDVVAHPLAESQLAAAITSVVHRADEMGPELQQRYGGRTAFGAPLPPRHLPIGGYL
jgi:hypothetical protein